MSGHCSSPSPGRESAASPGLCPAGSSSHIPGQRAAKPALPGGFCSQKRSWNPPWRFEQQQRQNYLKYYFANSVLNSRVMPVQIFCSYRTWVNRVKLRFCWFFCFQFYAKIHWLRVSTDHIYFKYETFLQSYLPFLF